MRGIVMLGCALAIGGCVESQRSDLTAESDLTSDSSSTEEVKGHSPVGAADASKEPDRGTNTASDIPRNGLVAEYLFNGNANDSTKSPAHAIATSVVPIADRFGHAESAYSFASNSVVKANNPKLPQANAPRSVAAWFLVSKNVGDGYKTIVNWGSPIYERRFGLSLHDGKTIFTSQGHDVEDTRDVRDGLWHLAVVTYQADEQDTVKVYVDRTCLRELDLTGFGIATAGETLMMGQKVASDSPEQWSGAIDDVRIYNRALEGAEVEELLHEGGR